MPITLIDNNKYLALDVHVADRGASFDLPLRAYTNKEADQMYRRLGHLLRPRHMLPECRVGASCFRQVFWFDDIEMREAALDAWPSHPYGLTIMSQKRRLDLVLKGPRFEQKGEVRRFARDLKIAFNAVEVEQDFSHTHYCALTMWLDCYPSSLGW